jgi:hypothetical protein
VLSALLSPTYLVSLSTLHSTTLPASSPRRTADTAILSAITTSCDQLLTTVCAHKKDTPLTHFYDCCIQH